MSHPGWVYSAWLVCNYDQLWCRLCDRTVYNMAGLTFKLTHIADAVERHVKGFHYEQTGARQDSAPAEGKQHGSARKSATA